MIGAVCRDSGLRQILDTGHLQTSLRTSNQESNILQVTATYASEHLIGLTLLLVTWTYRCL